MKEFESTIVQIAKGDGVLVLGNLEAFRINKSGFRVSFPSAKALLAVSAKQWFPQSLLQECFALTCVGWHDPKSVDLIVKRAVKELRNNV